MVHPDFTPDNYVTALLDLQAGGTTMLERFDIGDDEGRKTVLKVGPAGSVTVNVAGALSIDRERPLVTVPL